MGIRFEVPGEPRGKGRPRFHRDGHTYTDSETKAYERKIVAYYRKALGAFSWPQGATVAVEVTAVYPIPKRATKAALALMQSGKLLPTRKPDIDNVLKIVLDALNGVAWKDDSCVVELIGRKVYGPEPGIAVEMKGRV